MAYDLSIADLQADSEKILLFWDNNFPDWPKEKFEWFYKDNVCGKANVWLVTHTESGEVVGTTAIFPRDFVFDGRNLKAAITGDFAVDSRHRILGPAIKLQKATIANTGFSFVYGTPNGKSELVQKRSGYKQTGYLQRYVKILRLNSYIQRIFPNKLFVSLISPVLNTGFNFFQNGGRVDSSQFDYVLSDIIDDRMDKLWVRAIKQYDHLLMGKRDSLFLKWRVESCPYIDFKIFTLTDKKSNELIGYVIYCLGYNAIQLVDCFAIDMDHYYIVLLNAFIFAMRKEGHDSISVAYSGCEKVIQNLKEVGFMAKPGIGSAVGYTATDVDIFDNEKWYLFDIDND